MKLLITLGIFLTVFNASAQEDSIPAAEPDPEMTEGSDEPWLSGKFKATRIINGHSTQTLGKGQLEFRVEHRFGDFAGPDGGVQQWFGLDNSADIRLAFEYGLTDKWMAGIGRSKGTGRPYRSLLDGLTKYKFMDEASGSPFSASAMGMMTYTYQKASANIYDVSHFPKQIHRFAYAAQVIASKQITKRLAVSLMPTYVHRNYVESTDVNGLFSLGGAVKFGVTRQMGIIVEYYHTFFDADVRTENKQSLGVAVEWITFGHTFTVNLTNSRGFGETQFIPGTYEDWLKGQFRLGFTIGRIFSRS